MSTTECSSAPAPTLIVLSECNTVPAVEAQQDSEHSACESTTCEISLKPNNEDAIPVSVSVSYKPSDFIVGLFDDLSKQ